MFGYNYNNLNLEDLRKLAGLPAEKEPVVEDQNDPTSLDFQGPLDGLEGPWTMKNGRVVYYDPKEGKYYDRRQDMYLSDDEARELNEARDEKVGDKTPGIPGRSGGNDELLDEIDEEDEENEDEVAVEEDTSESEAEASLGESKVGKDLASVAKTGEEVTGLDEKIEGELSNGYKAHHTVKGDDHFPSGQDQSVSDEAGPASAKHGDNPMQKKTKVQVEEGKEIHRQMVYDYRSFLDESDNPLRILQDQHADLAARLKDAKARNDAPAIAALRAKLAGLDDRLERMQKPQF